MTGSIRKSTSCAAPPAAANSSRKTTRSGEVAIGSAGAGACGIAGGSSREALTRTREFPPVAVSPGDEICPRGAKKSKSRAAARESAPSPGKAANPLAAPTYRGSSKSGGTFSAPKKENAPAAEPARAKKSGAGRLLALLARVFTAPPVVVLASFTLIYARTNLFASLWHYLLLVGCLGLLPALAYPISLLVPALRRRGRDAQRPLALALSVAGYLLGALVVFLSPSVFTNFERVVVCAYLFSGVVIAVSSKLGFKCSGHAAGVAGPAFLLTLALGAPGALGFLPLALVIWSSLRLRRHTLPQLFVGALLPIAGTLLFRMIWMW